MIHTQHHLVHTIPIDNWKNFKKKKQITCQISSSLYTLQGSKFVLIVPSKRTGSWGIIPNRFLKSWRPIVEISTLSIHIWPLAGSTSRNNARISVDFPLPVRPTTPTFSPPSMVKFTPFKTKGVVGRYRNWSKIQDKCISGHTTSIYA